MERRRINVRTKPNSTAKPREHQCNGERTLSEPDVCPICSGSLYDIASTAVGWMTAAEYARAKATSEEVIIKAISRGDLDGRLVSGTWIVFYQ